jgi:hypothetical protein
MTKTQDTATLIAMVAEGFFSRLSFGLISFALPLYAYQLDMNLVEIGFLTSLSLTVSILLKPVFGLLADRFGFKRTLAVAIGVRSLVACLLVFAVVPWHLYLIRAIHGSSKSMRDPVANALIAESGGKKRIASSFAWYQTAKSMAGSGGKALAGILLTLTASNFAAVFGIAFLLSILPLLAVIRFVRPDQPTAHKPDKSEQSDQPQETVSSNFPQKKQPTTRIATLCHAGRLDQRHGIHAGRTVPDPCHRIRRAERSANRHDLHGIICDHPLLRPSVWLACRSRQPQIGALAAQRSQYRLIHHLSGCSHAGRRIDRARGGRPRQIRLSSSVGSIDG